MKFKSVSVAVLCTILLLPFTGASQFPEDALRFATPGFGVGARSLGMGNAYTAVANDFSALYWNPAGLGQMEHGEFSVGLSHLNYKNNSEFFGVREPFSNNATTLNSLGLVYPVATRQGSLVFAFGFARQSNFTTGVSFSGFNPNSSIIQAWAPDGQLYPPDVTIAEDLALAFADTNSGRFVSPIRDRVTQLGNVLEGGGLNNWSGSGAVAISKDLFIGATLTYLSGTYTFDRSYTEQDNRGIYSAMPFDFDQLTVDDFVQSDISGVNAKLGLMYVLPQRFRFGINIKTPSTLKVREDFGTLARSYFDNGDVVPTGGPFESLGSTDYEVVTPWVLTLGASVILRNLMISGDVEYTDWSQLKFEDANAELLALNKDIKSLFTATANVRAGAEYDLAEIGVRLRGGFMYNTSPFASDPGEFDQKYITGGLGVLLSGSTMLDLAYARGWWKSFRTNYNSSSRVDEDITTNNIILTFSYRF